MSKAIISLSLLLAAWSAEAQPSVFSANIVGYAAVTIPAGYSILGNPLSAGVTNGANEIGLQIEGEQILTWDGSEFNFVSYDSGLGGWVDQNFAPSAPPSLYPGTGFFFFNPLLTATNFTFVGQVIPGPSSTNCLPLRPGFSLISSPLPANVTNMTAAPISLPRIDFMQVLTWNNVGNNYVLKAYDSGFGGWIDQDFVPTIAPRYTIGQGFFLFNPSLSALCWQQSYRE